MLKPDNLLPVVGINMKLSEILKLDLVEVALEDQSLKENGIESTNALTNLSTLIFILLVVVLVVLILVIAAAASKKLREKIIPKLKKFVLGFYWNNTIKSVYISYLP